MFLITARVLIVLLTLLPVVPCSHGTDPATWMQYGESGVFLGDYSYSTIWNTVGRSPVSRTWLCLARKSRNFRCHKTRRHISMMILLLMLSGDVEINPGPVTRRNQSEQGGASSQPPTVPHPPHPEPTPPSSILDDERSRMFKQCYDMLKRHYRNLPTVAGDGKTPDVQFSNLATVERKCYGTKREKDISDFLQATIHGIDRYCETSEKIEYEDILNCGEVMSGKRVFISSAPGCGKTTLSHKLCKDLYSQSLPNQYFLVLLVELCRLKVYLDSSEVDIDLRFLFREFQRVLNLPELCQSLEDSGGEGVALILDGFDEIADRLGKMSFLTELLSVDNPYLSQCDVFVTTRPSRCPDLISLIQQPHRHVEILGFTNADINVYIKSFFTGVYPKDRRKAEDMSKEVIFCLERLPSVRGMCRIPVVLKIVCKVKEHLGSDPLPETLSGIFVMYICHQLVNYIRSAGHLTTGRIKNVLQVPSDLFPGFYPLCEVAYKCCIDKNGQRLILTDDDLGDVKKHLDARGSIYNLLFSEPVDEAASGVLYQFNHKTVQETMAAIHIARQSEEDQEMIWEEAYGRPEMAEVWKIYCGITKLEHVDLISLSHSFLSEHARDVIPSWYTKEDDMLVMTSLFESANSSVSAKVLPTVLKNSMNVHLKTPYDVHVLIYSLQHHHTLQRLHLKVSNIVVGPLLTDDFISALMSHNSLRKLSCSMRGDCGTVWEVYTEMFRKPHNLNVIELYYPPVELVLSALSGPVEELRLTPSQDYSEEGWRRIDEAVRTSTSLRSFVVPISLVAIPAVFIEHLCLNETLTELRLDDLSIHHNIPAQSLKNLLVHREKCTVKMSLTLQQWCAVLSGLRDVKKLKELSVHMTCPWYPSLPDQSDQCLTSDELEELVATSEQLVKVGVYIDPKMLKCVEDLLLAIVKGVSRNKNIVSINLVNDFEVRGRPDLDFVFKAPVISILETLAHSEHITHVKFKYMHSEIPKLLGDDWCQLLVDGPMSRPVCHLILYLSPAECGVLLSRVCDAERLEELSLVALSSGKDEPDEPDVKTVEDVMSNCTLKKLRISDSHDSPQWCNLWSAVVRGMAINNNDVDFALETDYHSRGPIMSQFPSQHMKKFEVLERSSFTYIISKPRVPTGDEERSLPSDESVSEMESSTVPGPSSGTEIDVDSFRSLILGDVHSIHLTHKGGTLQLHPFGLANEDCCAELTAPEGAVAEGVEVRVEYAVLLSGPFKLPMNWQRVSVVLYLNCPQRSSLSKPITLKLKHWATLSEDSNMCFMKASHVLLPNEVDFNFREVQSKGFDSSFGFLYLQDDFCLICQAIKAKHPNEVNIKCYGVLIEVPFDRGVQEIFLCCMYAVPSWINAMIRYYKYTRGEDKQFPVPCLFDFKGDKMRAKVRDMKGPGWIVNATEEALEISKDDLLSIEKHTSCDEKQALMKIGLYPPAMKFRITYEKSPSEQTHKRLPNCVELLSVTPTTAVECTFWFSVYSESSSHHASGNEERSLPSDESVSQMESSTVPGTSSVPVLTRKRSPPTSPALPGAKGKCLEKEDTEDANFENNHFNGHSSNSGILHVSSLSRKQSPPTSPVPTEDRSLRKYSKKHRGDCISVFNPPECDTC